MNYASAVVPLSVSAWLRIRMTRMLIRLLLHDCPYVLRCGHKGRKRNRGNDL